MVSRESRDFSSPSFPQPLIQNDRVWNACERKTFDAFSEWNFRFQISPG